MAQEPELGRGPDTRAIGPRWTATGEVSGKTRPSTGLRTASGMSRRRGVRSKGEENLKKEEKI